MCKRRFIDYLFCSPLMPHLRTLDSSPDRHYKPLSLDVPLDKRRTGLWPRRSVVRSRPARLAPGDATTREAPPYVCRRSVTPFRRDPRSISRLTSEGARQQAPQRARPILLGTAYPLLEADIVDSNLEKLRVTIPLCYTCIEFL